MQRQSIWLTFRDNNSRLFFPALQWGLSTFMFALSLGDVVSGFSDVCPWGRVSPDKISRNSLGLVITFKSHFHVSQSNYCLSGGLGSPARGSQLVPSPLVGRHHFGLPCLSGSPSVRPPLPLPQLLGLKAPHQFGLYRARAQVPPCPGRILRTIRMSRTRRRWSHHQLVPLMLSPPAPIDLLLCPPLPGVKLIFEGNIFCQICTYIL